MESSGLQDCKIQVFNCAIFTFLNFMYVFFNFLLCYLQNFNSFLLLKLFILYTLNDIKSGPKNLLTIYLNVFFVIVFYNIFVK